jgi:hypothetical protein
MPHESVAHNPHPNDIVVQRQRVAHGHYIVGTSNGRAQLICSTRAEALAVATSFARAASVRVWQIDNQERWSLLFESDAVRSVRISPSRDA